MRFVDGDEVLRGIHGEESAFDGVTLDAGRDADAVGLSDVKNGFRSD